MLAGEDCPAAPALFSICFLILRLKRREEGPPASLAAEAVAAEEEADELDEEADEDELDDEVEEELELVVADCGTAGAATIVTELEEEEELELDETIEETVEEELIELQEEAVDDPAEVVVAGGRIPPWYLLSKLSSALRLFIIALRRAPLGFTGKMWVCALTLIRCSCLAFETEDILLLLR